MNLPVCGRKSLNQETLHLMLSFLLFYYHSIRLVQGLYSPIRAGSCLECERGTYAAGGLNSTSGRPRSNGQGSDQCTTCPGGHFTPHNNMSSCDKCDAGQYAAARAFQCLNCKAGFIAAKPATVSCSACPAGRIAPEAGTVNCTDCKTGKSLRSLVKEISNEWLDAIVLP